MIKDVATGIIVQITVSLIVVVVVYLVGLLALDFSGAFEQFPREFFLLCGGWFLTVVATICLANISARKELEKSYSKKIEDLKRKNEDLEKDYGIVNDKLLKANREMEEMAVEKALEQARDREASWSKEAK